MPLAWIDPLNTVRDVAPGNPTLIYHPDVAAFYTVEVPEGTTNGATLQDGVWVNPPPPAPVEPQPPSAEAEAASIRSRRNTMLADSDWTQVADAPVDKNAWAVYRQALREVPQQPGFPFSVVWPEAPK
jgi:hypothetical protein